MILGGTWTQPLRVPGSEDAVYSPKAGKKAFRLRHALSDYYDRIRPSLHPDFHQVLQEKGMVSRHAVLDVRTVDLRILVLKYVEQLALSDVWRPLLLS